MNLHKANPTFTPGRNQPNIVHHLRVSSNLDVRHLNPLPDRIWRKEHTTIKFLFLHHTNLSSSIILVTTMGFTPNLKLTRINISKIISKNIKTSKD